MNRVKQYIIVKDYKNDFSLHITKISYYWLHKNILKLSFMYMYINIIHNVAG